MELSRHMDDLSTERANLNWAELPFGYMKTDAHVQYRFKDDAWSALAVVEGDTIELSISATALHYGQECFEGLKAFETRDGRVVAFRPDENQKRMERTAKKLCMEAPTKDIFLEAVDTVVRSNRRFIPPFGSGASLYVRPLLIGISGFIGVRPSREYMFLAFACPVGPYFKAGLKPIKLMLRDDIDRAAGSGVGDAKTGGNYAAGLRGMLQAREAGCAEALYLDPKEHKYIEETGASNVFAITKDGTYVTPQSSSILASITNMSLEQVAKDLGLKVERRRIHIDELPEFVEFGAVGTAAVITPVYGLKFKNKLIKFGDKEEVGPVTRQLYDTLTGTQTGDLPDTHGWLREIALD